MLLHCLLQPQPSFVFCFLKKTLMYSKHERLKLVCKYNITCSIMCFLGESYQAFGGLYVGQLHHLQVCGLRDHGVRGQGDNLVTHFGQGFTLRATNDGRTSSLNPHKVTSRSMQRDKVRNSPHAGSCFQFRTQSSPGEYSEEKKICYLKRIRLKWSYWPFCCRWI